MKQRDEAVGLLREMMNGVHERWDSRMDWRGNVGTLLARIDAEKGRETT
jgi:hypothetical protein